LCRKIDLIVFTKLDRWFRNISEYYKVQEVLEARHVNWKTIHEDYDTSKTSCTR
jgi:site-specific DNA recombinase